MILNWIMPKNRVAPIDIARELTEGDTSPDLEAGIEQVPKSIPCGGRGRSSHPVLIEKGRYFDRQQRLHFYYMTGKIKHPNYSLSIYNPSRSF